MTDERTARTPMVVSGTTATVLMSADEASARLADIRAALGGSEPVVAFLSTLTASGVRDLPPFACVGREDEGVRLLLRGCTSAVVRAPDGAESVHDAGAVSTWVETVAAPCAEVELRWDGQVTAVVVFEPVATLEPDGAATELEPEPTGQEAPGTDAHEDPPTLLAATPAEPAPAREPEEPPARIRSLRAPASAEVTRPPEPSDALGEVEAIESPVSSSPTPDSETEEVDLSHLFETRHVGVEAAAVRDEVDAPEGTNSTPRPDPSPDPLVVEAPPASPARLPAAPPGDAPPTGLISGVPRPGATTDPSPELGDHDGLTISPAQAAALRSGHAPAGPVGGPGAQLQAVGCPAGHLNPPQAVECRACQAPIQDHSIRLVHRPSLGHLRFDTGLVTDIDRPLLVGRKPTAEALKPGDEVPGLVALPDPDGLLSRVHLEIRIEGWEVLVVDRDSTNGTVIEVPGQAPVRLRPLEPVLITRGTRIVLADSAGCTFETGPR